MNIIYDPKLKTAKCGDKQIKFYCGDELHKIGTIVLQLEFNLITPQEANIALITYLNAQAYTTIHSQITKALDDAVKNGVIKA